MDGLPKQILHHHVPVIKSILKMKSKTKYLGFLIQKVLSMLSILDEFRHLKFTVFATWTLDELQLVFFKCTTVDFTNYTTNRIPKKVFRAY